MPQTTSVSHLYRMILCFIHWFRMVCNKQILPLFVPMEKKERRHFQRQPEGAKFLKSMDAVHMVWKFSSSCLVPPYQWRCSNVLIQNSAPDMEATTVWNPTWSWYDNTLLSDCTSLQMVVYEVCCPKGLLCLQVSKTGNGLWHQFNYIQKLLCQI